MPAKEIALDLAEFLDSSEAGALEAPRAVARGIAETFLALCYDELGKQPHLVDEQELHELVGHRLPASFGAQDPRAEHVPAVLRALFRHLEATRVVTQTFEQQRALEAALPEFLETVRTGRNAHHRVRERSAPFVHGAPKLGRNDPCSCGSGKKYKKCHGKDA